MRQFALMYVPLLLAFASVLLFATARRRPHLQRWLAPAMGVLLGWATAVHLGDDLPAARARRFENLNKLGRWRRFCPTCPRRCSRSVPRRWDRCCWNDEIW